MSIHEAGFKFGRIDEDGLPKHPNRIAVNLWIRGDDPHALMAGLGDEEAVKGIPVQKGQLALSPEMGVLNAEVGQPKFLDGLRDEILWRDAEWQLASVVFDLNFEAGDLAENQGVGRILQHETGGV